MTTVSFFAELFRRNPPLAWTGAINLLLFFILLAAMPFETRMVGGINLWIKPAKFSLSIAIYTWTLAWLLDALRAHPAAVRFITWGVVTAMTIEQVLIVGQAARGVASHFNEATGGDAAVFILMGVAILFNTLLLGWMALLFFQMPLDTPDELPSGYLWGIRLGILVTILGSAVGGVMSSRLQHSIGVADGGAGLPFVNWSVTGGDLRVAHFIGLHALQALPLTGWIFSLVLQERATAATIVVSLLYAAAVAAVFVQAMTGKPLLSLR